MSTGQKYSGKGEDTTQSQLNGSTIELTAYSTLPEVNNLPDLTIDPRAFLLQTRLIDLTDKFAAAGFEMGPMQAIGNLLAHWQCTPITELSEANNADQLHYSLISSTNYLSFVSFRSSPSLLRPVNSVGMSFACGPVLTKNLLLVMSNQKSMNSPMIYCQQIQPIAKDEKVPYFYLRHSPQPLTIRFDFLPKYTHRSSVGNVTVSFYVADREYGPYVTSIGTTTAVWDKRTSIYPSKSAQEVTAMLRGLQALFEKSWHSLLSLDLPITGEMILKKAGLTEKEMSHE